MSGVSPTGRFSPPLDLAGSTSDPASRRGSQPPSPRSGDGTADTMTPAPKTEYSWWNPLKFIWGTPTSAPETRAAADPSVSDSSGTQSGEKGYFASFIKGPICNFFAWIASFFSGQGGEGSTS